LYIVFFAYVAKVRLLCSGRRKELAWKCKIPYKLIKKQQRIRVEVG